jgi:hypothetical protein
MHKRLSKGLAIILIMVTVTLVIALQPGPLLVSAQIPTGSVPTVTGTPKGPVASVRPDINEDFANVRSGPGVFYPAVGVLLIGQEVPAVGKSPGGEWILIEYAGAPGGTGWVYGPYLNLTPGANLPAVQPPPTPTPQFTPTIDPTMAAQFVVTAAPTRLPTFTPPPPLAIPTFQPVSGFGTPGNVPMGLVILILAAMGVIIGFISVLQGR